LALGAPVHNVRVELAESAETSAPDWWANASGVGLNSRLIATPDARSYVRFVATMYGAVVHHALACRGVENATPLGATLLDIARAWFQHRVFVVEGPMPEESPALPELARDSSAEDIAAVLGAALAGNRTAQARLSNWQRIADPPDVVIAQQLWEQLSAVNEPTDLVESVFAIYEQALDAA
jgi:hypothetical protein